MQLIDAPVGVLLFNNTLILKTEYVSEIIESGMVLYSPQCYILETGEVFYGGAKTCAERNRLNVTPVEVSVVRHGRWEIYPDSAHLRCTNCKIEFKREKMPDTRHRCPNCGAKMDGGKGCD